MSNSNMGVTGGGHKHTLPSSNPTLNDSPTDLPVAKSPSLKPQSARGNSAPQSKLPALSTGPKLSIPTIERSDHDAPSVTRPILIPQAKGKLDSTRNPSPGMGASKLSPLDTDRSGRRLSIDGPRNTSLSPSSPRKRSFGEASDGEPSDSGRKSPGLGTTPTEGMGCLSLRTPERSLSPMPDLGKQHEANSASAKNKPTKEYATHSEWRKDKRKLEKDTVAKKQALIKKWHADNKEHHEKNKDSLFVTEDLEKPRLPSVAKILAKHDKLEPQRTLDDMFSSDEEIESEPVVDKKQSSIQMTEARLRLANPREQSPKNKKTKAKSIANTMPAYASESEGDEDFISLTPLEKSKTGTLAPDATVVRKGKLLTAEEAGESYTKTSTHYLMGLGHSKEQDVNTDNISLIEAKFKEDGQEIPKSIVNKFTELSSKKYDLGLGDLVVQIWNTKSLSEKVKAIRSYQSVKDSR